MAQIHVIYDPDDRIMSRPEDMKWVRAQAVTVRIEGPIDINRVDRLANDLTVMLLREIERSQQ